MYKKISFLSSLLVLALAFSGCKEDKKPGVQPIPAEKTYSSIDNFYEQNGVKLQSYKINASAGGSFTSPKGTLVTVPANCFVSSGNVPATGEVTVQFKDIYAKSDMLLSDVPTSFFNGAPMKSGGEFFINALLNNEPLKIAAGMRIEVAQPLLGLEADTAMEAMVLDNDSLPGGVNNGGGWFISQSNSLLYTTTNYIFNLYQFSGNTGAGTWCNSDNPYYFQAFTQTTLTINDVSGYDLDVFLVFKNVNSMIHIYKMGADYPYAYAPVGLEATVVVLGVKDEKLYASFTPITITSNLTVNPALTEITTEAFKAQLNALN